MKTYYIDTNCLISYVTDRNTGQQNRIAPFFEKAAVLEHKLIISEHVITEFIYVCTAVYELEADTVRAMLLDLINTPGMEVEPCFPLTVVLHLWPAFITTYADAVIAACVQERGGILLTFDRELRTKCGSLNIGVCEI